MSAGEDRGAAGERDAAGPGATSATGATPAGGAAGTATGRDAVSVAAGAPSADRPLIEVVEFTDPGCVWSWGSEPRLRWLRRHYGDQLSWRRVFGVQVDDLARTHPTRDAVRDAGAFRDEWLVVAEHTDAPVPVRLERMHRSTLPASYAVRAAERQDAERDAAERDAARSSDAAGPGAAGTSDAAGPGAVASSAGGRGAERASTAGDRATPGTAVPAAGDGIADRVLRRLRESVFVHGRPADTSERLVEALAGIEGLDLERLLRDVDDPEIHRGLQADWEATRNPHPAVVGRTGPGPNPGAAKQDGERVRYGFPTLIVRGPAGEQVIAGWNDVETLTGILEAAGVQPVDVTAVLEPDEALARYRTLTAEDLRLSTGGREPRDAVRIETATTPLWVHPDEVGPVGGVEGARVGSAVAAD
ncbi:hypothetical protein AB0L40_18545 [Patulibacter sp. NPDC049589]|uniref:DsbA family oxidoreductase n=1 Tax=Patulibacter sp. NPDC049589 TaxID=3154731 RepID=UPI00343B48A1